MLTTNWRRTAVAFIFYFFNNFFLISAVELNSSHWLLNCGSNGIKTCTSSDPSLNIDSQSVTISNCIFIGCPSISVTLSTIQVTNVTFQNTSDGGSAWTLVTSSASFTDCNFLNCVSMGNGGACSLQTGTNATFLNVHFYRNQALGGAGTGGGAIFSLTAHFNCTNCTFLENYSNNAGSAFLLSAHTTADVNGGYIQNQTSPWGAGFYLGNGGQITLRNFVFKNLNANFGAGVFLSSGNPINQVTMYDVVANNFSAASQGGFLYSYASGALTCYRCNFTNGYAWDGAVALVQDLSTADFYDSYIANAVSSSGTFWVDGSTLSLHSGTLVENSFAAYGGTASVLVGSNFYCNDSFVRNSSVTTTGGCFNIGSGNTLTINNCTFTGCQAGTQGGFANSAGTIIIRNSAISASHALSGGTIFATGSSATTLDNVQIWNSTADVCGGAIYSDTSSTITLEENVQINVADTSTPRGQFLCYYQSDMSLLQYIGTLSVLPIYGTVFIAGVTASEYYINNLMSLLPNAAPSGSASEIAWMSKPQLLPQGESPGTPIPPFSVYITDRFGNVPPFSYTQIPVVQAVSLNGGTLSGETIKAWITPNNIAIVFDNLVLTNVTPGVYNISVIPVAQTLVYEVTDTFPTFSLKIAVCSSNQEFSPTYGCLPIRETTMATRIGFAIAGGVLLIVTVLCSLGIYHFRELRLVKGSAPLFLWIMNAGVLQMSLALLTGVLTGDAGCITRVWFENIGFLTIFVPLILKTKRIQLIFQREFGSTKKYASRLKNNYLLKNLGITAFAAVTAMIVWTAVAPPTIEAPVFHNSYVSVGGCKTTTGDLIAICVQIVVLLYAVQLAFSVRDAPENFNESKVIVFATYNWAVFIGIGIAVAEFAIDDPQVAFIIESISIFIPSLVHTLCLTGYKVYLCLTNPEAANVIHESYTGGSKKAEGKSISSNELTQNTKTVELTQQTPRTPGAGAGLVQQFSFGPGNNPATPEKSGSGRSWNEDPSLVVDEPNTVS